MLGLVDKRNTIWCENSWSVKIGLVLNPMYSVEHLHPV